MISPDYLASQRALHARPDGYGGKGDKWADGVMGLIAQFKASSVLDYGCGQGALVRRLRARAPGVRFAEYDPAVAAKNYLPSFADLVVCTDVLEHIEPDRLTTVLQHLDMLARTAIFVVVATRPSNKTLPDGRNAHLIIESAEWWAETCLAHGFTVSPGPASPLAKPSREWVAILTREAV
jgi:2-polyprenyl-3-methyl-5-hydroxy-6-metoxy-1,4-benzoquinol methylase